MSYPIPTSIPDRGHCAFFSDPQAAFQAALLAHQAQKEGHAVAFWETFDDHKRFVDATVLHYRTCRLCGGMER